MSGAGHATSKQHVSGSGRASGYGSERSSSRYGEQRTVRIGANEVQHRLRDRNGRARFVVQRAGLSSQCLLHLFEPLPRDPQAQLRERLSACSRVTHRALAATLEVGEDSNRIYVVREHVPGVALSAALAESLPSSNRVLEWGLSVGEALLLLAGSEVVVGQIDPDSVVLDGDRVCLLEVGFEAQHGDESRHCESLALAGLLLHALCGVPVAPGQAPKRPRRVPASVWRLLTAAHADPPPLSPFLISLRQELSGRPSKGLGSNAAAVWIGAAILLLSCGATGAVATYGARKANRLAKQLKESQAANADLQQEIDRERALIAEFSERAPTPPSVEPPSRPPAQAAPDTNLRALEALHAATSKPRLVAKRLIEHWLAALPEEPAAREARARYCFYLGNGAQALREFAQAAQASELSPNASAMYALCLMGAGRGPESKQVLEALSTQECPEGVWAQGLLQRGTPEGRELIVAAARQAPLSAPIQKSVLQGPRANASAAQHKALIQRWDALVTAHPAWESALYSRSHALYAYWIRSRPRSDEVVAAFVRDLKSARDLSPNPIYWIYDGKSYVEIGRPRLALGPLQVANRLLENADPRARGESSLWTFVALAMAGEDTRARRQLELLRQFGPQMAQTAMDQLRQRDAQAASRLGRDE